MSHRLYFRLHHRRVIARRAHRLSQFSARILGLLLGIASALVVLHIVDIHVHLSNLCYPDRKTKVSSVGAVGKVGLGEKVHSSDELRVRDVFQTVIIANGNDNSYINAASTTWGKTISGLVVYCSQETCLRRVGQPGRELHIVDLKGTEQDKMHDFSLALRHICSSTLDLYQWHVFLTGRFYMNYPALKKLLGRSDAKHILFDEGFVALHRQILQQLCPHLHPKIVSVRKYKSGDWSLMLDVLIEAAYITEKTSRAHVHVCGPYSPPVVKITDTSTRVSHLLSSWKQLSFIGPTQNAEELHRIHEIFQIIEYTDLRKKFYRYNSTIVS